MPNSLSYRAHPRLYHLRRCARRSKLRYRCPTCKRHPTSTSVRNRRVSPVAPRPREGPLTEPIAGAQPRPQERVLMPHSRPCPDGLNLDKLDRGHCLAECDMTSGQKLPSQGEREVQRPTRAGRQNALHVQSQGRVSPASPIFALVSPPGSGQTWSFKSLCGIRSHSPKHPFPGWLRWSPQHDASLFTSISGRATTRSNIGLFLRNVPGFREASN